MRASVEPMDRVALSSLDVETAVRRRYAGAAAAREEALCCPVQYDGRYLDVLPREIVDRDYGCGDPSCFLHEGETVLDLGSGAGKICYIAAQIVGPTGQVFGVDANDEMLALARKHQPEIGQRIGYHNTRFFKGRIQDLKLDLERFESHLAAHPVQSSQGWLEATAQAEQMRQTDPMIAADSVDVVVSNCVLNLVRVEDRIQLFREMFRVLRRGGRAVISDIVSDEVVPESLRSDPHLWSGCISGAFVEHEFLKAFEAAGFYGIQILRRQTDPWAVVEGIEFRSVTVEACKGKEGPCRDQDQAVIYRGPWKSVTDDDGHVLRRGEPMAVCGKTYAIYTRQPYADQILPVPPRREIPTDEAPEFDCRRAVVRTPRETKGDQKRTLLPTDGCCSSGDSCC